MYATLTKYIYSCDADYMFKNRTSEIDEFFFTQLNIAIKSNIYSNESLRKRGSIKPYISRLFLVQLNKTIWTQLISNQSGSRSD